MGKPTSTSTSNRTKRCCRSRYWCRCGCIVGGDVLIKRIKLFRYCTKLDAKLIELAPLTHNLAKRSCVGTFRNARHRSTPLDRKLMFWGVSEHFVTARKSMQNSPNWCHKRASSLHKVEFEFFATKAPDPLHWTQFSCFGAFRTVSLLHESRCKTGRTSTINAQVR
jgi:hypothetical protein